MVISTILYCLIGILSAVYLYSKWHLSYWKRNGYKSVGINLTKYPSEYILQSYKTLKKQHAKFGGIYLLFYRILVPVDLELLKNILQKNSNYFINRDVYCNEKAEPLMASLFSLKDDAWKNLRTKLNPLFSAGKILSKKNKTKGNRWKLFSSLWDGR